MDNSNNCSPREDDCGDAEEEEREQATDEKSSTSSQLGMERSSGTTNPPR